jgi:hypothetical protein
MMTPPDEAPKRQQPRSDQALRIVAAGIREEPPRPTA